MDTFFQVAAGALVVAIIFGAGYCVGLFHASVRYWRIGKL